VSRDLPGSHTMSATIAEGARYGALVIAAVFFALPVILMVLTSLRPLQELVTETLISLPRNLDPSNWPRAWSSA